MGKNPIARSGVFNRRIFLAIILCSVGVSLALLASAVPVASNGNVSTAVPLGSASIAPADFAATSGVTITEFSDFQCPYCQQAAVVVEQLRQVYGSNVKFVFKQMPLPMHQYAFKAAQAAVIAQQQGKFWEYHDRLFAARDLSVDALKKIAVEVGLKQNEFSQGLDSPATRAAVEKDIRDARQLGVRGTPTFFVNGKIVRGAATLATLTRAIDRALTRPTGQELLQAPAGNDDSSCEDSGSRAQVNLPTLIKVAFTQETQAAASTTRGGSTLSINDVTLVEDSCQGNSFVFTVALSKLASKMASVHYATSNGRPDQTGAAALANNDYVPVSGTLTFTHNMRPNGPEGSYLLTITVPLGNYVVSAGGNDARAFTVTLSGATNAVISKAQGVGTLLNAAIGCTGLSDNVCFTAVNYCGATTSCTVKQVNTSACGTPWCTLLAGGGATFATCNASGAWADSDGDGLPDAAEAQGYIDVNCNGVYDPGIDIPLPGADPHKPDVYLHYDYTYASDHDHNPPPAAIQWIVDAFAAQGINLHIDPQHNAISESIAQVVTLANPPDPACTGPNAVSMHQLREIYPNLALLKPAYHYMVFGHYASCNPAVDPNTGMPYCSACPNDPENPACGVIAAQKPQPDNLGTAEIFGDDAIVATQAFTDVGLLPIPLEAWAGLAMHEFGHNLGLEHGGGDCFNDKPNYVSVMNYNFYTKGIPVGASPGDAVPKPCATDADCVAPAHCSLSTNTCFRIDYSDRQFNGLDESGATTGLDETIGLQGGVDDTDISWHKAGNQFLRIPTNGSPIDWNGDGNATETSLIFDVNGDGQKTPLGPFNDWTNLQFSYQCQPTFGD